MIVDFRGDLKATIVRSLNLPISPAEIKDDAPLFGDGLGLDSIDALELIVALEKEYDVTFPDLADAVKVFSSVDALAEFIERATKDVA